MSHREIQEKHDANYTQSFYEFLWDYYYITDREDFQEFINEFEHREDVGFVRDLKGRTWTSWKHYLQKRYTKEELVLCRRLHMIYIALCERGLKP